MARKAKQQKHWFELVDSFGGVDNLYESIDEAECDAVGPRFLHGYSVRRYVFDRVVRRQKGTP